MSAEIIDQANELAERRLEMTIQNMRINHNAVSATHCRDCGEEIPERRRELVAGCQRCADCQETRNYAASIGGDGWNHIALLWPKPVSFCRYHVLRPLTGYDQAGLSQPEKTQANQSHHTSQPDRHALRH